MSNPTTPTGPKNALEWAQFYAALGWSVVPVRHGEKIPAEKWARYQTIPADANQLLAWFADRPDFGVGLVQGSRAGTIVLDFDAKDGGLDTLRDLEARGLPASVRAFTPGGGCHVILRHPGRYVPTRKQVRPGMDVRGDGGFIVAAPSTHASGRQYVWDVDCHPEDCVVEDCPAWLADLITSEAPATPGGDIVRVPAASGPLGLPQDLVSDGREQYMRDTILAVCVDLRDRLGRLPTAEELTAEAWPQYAAKVDFRRPGRGEAEFRAKVAYTLARASAGMVKGLQAKPMPQAPIVFEDVDPETGEITIRACETPLPLVYWDDVKPNLDAADFIEGLLIDGAMSVVYGPSNCGKTFFMADLALHVAAGHPWRGKAVEQGGVIYCALEGSHGISNRLAAFRAHRNLEGQSLPIAVIPVALNLLDPAADRGRLIETIQAAASRMGLPVRLIVIDTLSRAMAGGNENAPDDMGALVAGADAIRQATRGHLCFIHHSGKDQAAGARGHSLLRAATDTEIEITRPDPKGPSVARVTKQRELEIEGEFAFVLHQVTLGTNRRGKPVTSCVVEPSEADAIAPGKPRLNGDAKRAFEILQDLCASETQSIPGIPGQANTSPSVSEDAWRQAFYSRAKPGAEYQAKKKAFGRASSTLLEMRQVGMNMGRIWLCHPT